MVHKDKFSACEWTVETQNGNSGAAPAAQGDDKAITGRDGNVKAAAQAAPTGVRFHFFK